MRPASRKTIAAAVLAGMCLLLYAPTAGAIGLAVAPSELDLRGAVGELVKASVAITNTSNGVAIFEAWPDDLRSMVAVSPASFTLQGGESREITVSVKAPAGKFATMISVTATPMSSSGFKAGAGVKIPLRVAIADGDTGLLASIGNILGASALPVGAGVLALAIFLRFFKISPRRHGDKAGEIGSDKKPSN